MPEPQVHFSIRSLGLAIIVLFSAGAFSLSAGNYDPAALLLYLILLVLGLSLIYRYDAAGSRDLPILAGRTLILALFWFHLLLQWKTLRVLYAKDEFQMEQIVEIVSRLPIMGALLFLTLWKKVDSWRWTKWIVWLLILDISFGILNSLVRVILVSPKPLIDVWYIYNLSVFHLLAGVNPYNAEYPNLFPGSPWYPEGKVDFYAYPPLTFLFNFFGVVFGDVRWGLLGSHVIGAAFVFFTALRGGLRKIESFALGCLVLAVPYSHFVIEQSWNEPYIVLVIGLFTFFMYGRSGRRALLAAAFVISLKQTMIIFLALLLGHWRRWKFTGLALLGSVAALSYGIFYLIDPAAIWHDTVTHFRQTPFRSESLSILAWLHATFDVKFPTPPNAGSTIVLILVSVGGFFFLRRKKSETPFEPAGFSLFWLVFAVAYLAFVLVGKQAFTNYYYLLHILLVHALLWSRLGDVESGETTGETSSGENG